MATIYLRSTTGNNANDGLSWANAKATLAAALTAAGAGGTVYVSQAHAESNAASITLASPGTAAAPVIVLCVNDGAEPPTTPATGALVKTAGGNYNIAYSGFAYVNGVEFITVATGGAYTGTHNFITSAAWSWVLVNCAFRGLQTVGSSSAQIAFGATSSPDDQRVVLVNTKVQMPAGSSITVRCPVEWWDTVEAIDGTPPALLFNIPGNTTSGRLRIVGVDLSAVTADLAYMGNGSFAELRFENCHLGMSPSAALTGATASFAGVQADFYNCDSGDTNWNMFLHRWGGTIEVVSSVYRTDGASDGTTPISWKMATNANVSEAFPLYTDEIVIWNETTGSAKTITAEITHSAAADLTDAEIWMEVEVLGTSGYPVSNWVTTQRGAGTSEPHSLMTASTEATSTVGWTGAGTRKQKLEASVTPQEKGPIRVRFVLAKASTTVYVCPKIEVS